VRQLDFKIKRNAKIIEDVDMENSYISKSDHSVADAFYSQSQNDHSAISQMREDQEMDN
jgi:hypothetical protein